VKGLLVISGPFSFPGCQVPAKNSPLPQPATYHQTHLIDAPVPRSTGMCESSQVMLNKKGRRKSDTFFIENLETFNELRLITR